MPVGAVGRGIAGGLRPEGRPAVVSPMEAPPTGPVGASGATGAPGAGTAPSTAGTVAEPPSRNALRIAAATKIEKRFAQDAEGGGLTAQGALDKMNEARAVGKPLTLADLGGENVKGLA